MRSSGNQLGHFAVAAFFAFSLAGVAGCGDDEPEFDGGAPQLTDPQIGSILITANQNAVNAGEVAQTRGSATQVVAFANRMVTEHSAAITDTQSILRLQNIGTADSTVNQQLTTEGNQLVPQLRAAAAGTNFDLTYMCSQVRSNAELIALIDAQLLPDAQNAVLRTNVQTNRALAQSDLNDALTIVQSLGSQLNIGLSTSLSDGGTTDSQAAAVCASFGGIVPPAVPTNG